MTTINWHTEALNFCKKNGVHPSNVPLVTIEAAMRAGARLIVDRVSTKIIKSKERLEKAHKESESHKETKIPLTTLFL